MARSRLTPGQRAERMAAKRRRRQADRALAPVAVSRVLEVPVRELAAWMREAGEATPVTVVAARRWKAHPDTAPEWLSDRLACKQAKRDQSQRRAAEREQAERDAREARLEQLYRDAVRMLADGDRKLRQGRWLETHDDHETVLADIAWRAAKDCGLASGDENPDWWALTYAEREALRVCGYRLPPEPDTTKVVSLRMARYQRGSV